MVLVSIQKGLYVGGEVKGLLQYIKNIIDKISIEVLKKITIFFRKFIFKKRKFQLKKMSSGFDYFFASIRIDDKREISEIKK